MKSSRRLGRGLEMLVPLAPAGADGRVNLDEALRGGPTASVLALSGHSLDEIVRAAPAPRPAPVPWTEPPAEPAASSAPPRATAAPAPPQGAPQAAPPVAQAASPPPPPPAPPPPAARPPAPPPVPPEPAFTDVQFDLFDPPIGDILLDEDALSEAPTQAVPRPAPPAPAAPPPAPRAAPAPPPAPARAAPAPPPPAPKDDSLFLDDEIGGIVLPDIDLE